MKKEMRKSKTDSYLKFILWMVIGGAFGMVAGIVFVMAGRNVEALVKGAEVWMSRYASWILVMLLVISVVFCILCYRKGETLLKKLQETQEDEQVEKLEDAYDFWGNIGLTGSGIIMYIAIAVYAFDICGREGLLVRTGEEMFLGLIGTVMFLVVTIVCGFYQVAAVKQIRRKEPMKQGDAADFDFEKQWLASCDEGEKRVLYEAGYRAYASVKIILLAAVVVALLGEVFLGIGLSAVVILTICNVISAVIYSYYCRKLEKGKLD